MPKKQKRKIAILDYGMGNLFSVRRACEDVGLDAVTTHQPQDIHQADGVILPGVGAFGDAMAHLEELDLVDPIKDFVKSGRPFLGICLGMQLLMSESEEFGAHRGLNIVPGAVKRLDPHSEVSKVPEVGWNQIYKPSNNSSDYWRDTPLHNIEEGEYVYFVHSYFVQPEEPEVVLSMSSYEGVDFCSSLRFKNVFATQFHPEKSAAKGLQIYQNWTECF